MFKFGRFSYMKLNILSTKAKNDTIFLLLQSYCKKPSINSTKNPTDQVPMGQCRCVHSVCIGVASSNVFLFHHHLKISGSSQGKALCKTKYQKINLVCHFTMFCRQNIMFKDLMSHQILQF